ncbi:type IV pilin protein [Kaarinaea lacus]
MKLIKCSTLFVAGFCLHEILIILVFLATLSAVAIPAFHATALKERRSDGVAALKKAAARMEQFYLDNKSYTTNLTQLGYKVSPVASMEGYYKISALPATTTCPAANCYVLQAVAVRSQRHDTDCKKIILSSKGSKTPAVCW